jgi:hypothetical protein
MNTGGILAIAFVAFVISADVGGLLRGDAKAEEPAASQDAALDSASLGGRVHISFCGS